MHFSESAIFTQDPLRARSNFRLSEYGIGLSRSYQNYISFVATKLKGIGTYLSVQLLFRATILSAWDKLTFQTVLNHSVV